MCQKAKLYKVFAFCISLLDSFAFCISLLDIIGGVSGHRLLREDTFCMRLCACLAVNHSVSLVTQLPSTAWLIHCLLLLVENIDLITIRLNVHNNKLCKVKTVKSDLSTGLHPAYLFCSVDMTVSGIRQVARQKCPVTPPTCCCWHQVARICRQLRPAAPSTINSVHGLFSREALESGVRGLCTFVEAP